MVNPVAAGFVAGGILARNSGPTGAVGGGLAFAAFSAAIDLFLRREPAEYVSEPLKIELLLISYTSDD
jgi:import inner membrane translocase subunit TIM22